ncbi:MAG: Lrp/AsnC family transcriptional regulator [Candidatus Protistobacter heckmanni]|nr:Lrp/AsnC family transcriptional regulator [Candidatus Protistobacter heckmanni]
MNSKPSVPMGLSQWSAPWGCAAKLNPVILGLGLTAFVNVRLDKRGGSAPGKGPYDAFKASVGLWPEVVACYAMTGEMDYLLKVVVEDMDHFSRLMHDCLLEHPAVVDVRTSFLLDPIKGTTALPMPSSATKG